MISPAARPVYRVSDDGEMAGGCAEALESSPQGELLLKIGVVVGNKKNIGWESFDRRHAALRRQRGLGCRLHHLWMMSR